MKILIQNSRGDLKLTGADVNGKVFREYIMSGYKVIGSVTGMNVSVKGLPLTFSGSKQYVDKQNAIINEEQTL